MSGQTDLDYLLIGHIARDLTPDGPKPGGTVTFSGRLAQALGCRTAVLTSAAGDIDLGPIFPGIPVRAIPAAKTTTFVNTYTPAGRQQMVQAVAEPIRPGDVPAAWRRAPIVHLAPIANEIDPALIGLFSNSLVGLTPQGWFRRWDDDGRVHHGDWPEAEQVLPLAGAVILSPEDLPDEAWLARLQRWSRLLVLTRSEGGCTVFCRDETRHVPAPAVAEVNPTGAGDIFATAFLIRLHQTRGNPWEAAEFANRVASVSVTQDSLDDKIEAIKELVRSES